MTFAAKSIDDDFATTIYFLRGRCYDTFIGRDAMPALGLAAASRRGRIFSPRHSRRSMPTLLRQMILFRWARDSDAGFSRQLVKATTCGGRTMLRGLAGARDYDALIGLFADVTE